MNENEFKKFRDDWHKRFNAEQDFPEKENRMRTDAKNQYRLELIYDQKSNSLVLQGSLEALTAIRDQLNMMIDPQTAEGTFIYFDRFTQLTDTNTEMRIYIKRVGE